MATKPEQFITIPLKRFISKYVLGDGYWHDRPIHPDDAQIIYELCKNQHTCFIQFKDEYDNHLDEPRLWDHGAWQNATEHQDRLKKWSARQRVLRNIQDANIKMVAKSIKRDWGFDDKYATATALSLVSRNLRGNLLALGVEKLYETEEEIP